MDKDVKSGLRCQICQKLRAADGTGAVIINNRPDGDNIRYHCLSCYANAFQLCMEYAKILNADKIPSPEPDIPKRKRSIPI